MEMPTEKSWIAGVFDRAAPTYDRVGVAYHDELGRRLVERAGPSEGAVVLDVACGKGAVLVPAAQKLGSSGRLVGIDISPEMVRLAERELARVESPPAFELDVMDAERLLLEDASFDFVFCAFAVFFLPDPARAMAEFARVLRPLGTLAISSWGEDDPRWDWAGELIQELGVERGAVVHPFDSEESLRALVVDAGLDVERIDREQLDVVFADEEEWWDWHWSFSLRGSLEQAGAEELERYRLQAYDRMQGLREDDGFPMRLDALFAIAQKPS